MSDIFEHDVFADRAEAGRRLAEELRRFKHERPVVLALPRGGVPVAYEVAKALAAPLDLVLVRKIGAPFQPELAIGAVVDGERPELVINRDLIEDCRIPRELSREGAAAPARRDRAAAAALSRRSAAGPGSGSHRDRDRRWHRDRRHDGGGAARDA